jgi:DNA processing protein
VVDTLTLSYLTLTHTRGLGPRRIKTLVDAFGSAEAVLNAPKTALLEVEGVGPNTYQALSDAKASDWPKQELARAKKLNVTLLHLEHPAYPIALRSIYDPPSLLYVRGQLPDLIGATPASIGIVGTRDASDYARNFTLELARNLAQAGVTVISGLALGIDAAAHSGALQAEGGRTIAVLGSGVDVIYPHQNSALASQMMAGHGAVISEYPLGTRPLATNFPGRNRIISGLSSGIVVVEAAQRSGALITADYALQEGRTVFAVPGRAADKRAEGNLGLLKQGAVLITGAEDILNELNWQTATVQSPRPPQPELEPDEAALFKLIEDRETVLLDELALSTGESAAKLLPRLTLLELKGVIQVDAGGRWQVQPAFKHR